MANSAFLGDGLAGALAALPAARRAASLRERPRFEAQLLDGTVGPAAASELVAFLRLFRAAAFDRRNSSQSRRRHLPRSRPRKSRLLPPWAECLSDHSIAKGMQYLDRMPTEMRVLAMRDAAAREPAITHTPEFVRFGVEHAELCGV